MAQTSLVDYLKSSGGDSSLSGRANLAVSKGLVSSASEYMNLAAQGKNADINTKLLSSLQSTPVNQNAPVVNPVVAKNTVSSTPIVSKEPMTSSQFESSVQLPEPTTFVGVNNTGTLSNKISQVAKTSLTDSNKAAIDNLQALRLEAIAKEKAAAEYDVSNLKGELASNINTTQTQDALTNIYDKYKIEENLALYNDIQTKIVDAQQALNMGLIYEADRPARMKFVTGSESTLQKQGLATIGALQGTAAVIKGNVELAKSFADSTIDAITADNKTSFDALNTLLDLANNDLIQLGKDEKDIIDKRLTTLEDEATRIQTNKDAVTDLMIKYPKAFLAGGVTLLDSKESALQKMMPTMAADEKAKFDADIAASYKTSSSATTAAELVKFKEELSGLKAKGMTYEEAVNAYGPYVGVDYINDLYGISKTSEGAITNAYYDQFIDKTTGKVKEGYSVSIDAKGNPVVEKTGDAGAGFWSNIGNAFKSLF